MSAAALGRGGDVLSADRTSKLELAHRFGQNHSTPVAAGQCFYSGKVFGCGTGPGQLRRQTDLTEAIEAMVISIFVMTQATLPVGANKRDRKRPG